MNVSELEDAAAIFKALSDPARLRILILLSDREMSVGELTDQTEDQIGTVSARLQVLMQARLVARRREGKSMIYALADAHVVNLVENAIDHAREPDL